VSGRLSIFLSNSLQDSKCVSQNFKLLLEGKRGETQQTNLKEACSVIDLQSDSPTSKLSLITGISKTHSEWRGLYEGWYSECHLFSLFQIHCVFQSTPRAPKSKLTLKMVIFLFGFLFL